MTSRLKIKKSLIASAVIGFFVVFVYLDYAAIAARNAIEKVAAAPKNPTTTAVSTDLQNTSPRLVPHIPLTDGSEQTAAAPHNPSTPQSYHSGSSSELSKLSGTTADRSSDRHIMGDGGLLWLKTTLPAKYHFRSVAQKNTQAKRQPEPITKLSAIIPDVLNPVTSNGMVPVFYKLTTQQPVVFLTIDDGVVKDSAVATFMSEHHIMASMFLNDSRISSDYDYFRNLQSLGNPIENHTVSHHNLTKLTYAQQKKEICDNADSFATAFGKRPTLFRPPYGAFNDITRRAAADCGMTALIHWHAKANDGSMQYQQGDKLQPGDIVLMHFSKEVIADLTAFTDAAQKANLRAVLLEDWIK